MRNERSNYDVHVLRWHTTRPDGKPRDGPSPTGALAAAALRLVGLSEDRAVARVYRHINWPVCALDLDGIHDIAVLLFEFDLGDGSGNGHQRPGLGVLGGDLGDRSERRVVVFAHAEGDDYGTLVTRGVVCLARPVGRSCGRRAVRRSRCDTSRTERDTQYSANRRTTSVSV